MGNDGDVTPRPKLSKDVLRTLNSAKGILSSVDSITLPPNRNLHKKFLTVPRSLPSKLVMDVQRERWQVRTTTPFPVTPPPSLFWQRAPSHDRDMWVSHPSHLSEGGVSEITNAAGLHGHRLHFFSRLVPPSNGGLGLHRHKGAM